MAQVQGYYQQALTLSSDGGIHLEIGVGDRVPMVLLIPLDPYKMDEGIIGLFVMQESGFEPVLKRVFCHQPMTLRTFLLERQWDGDDWWNALPRFPSGFTLEYAHNLIHEMVEEDKDDDER